VIVTAVDYHTAGEPFRIVTGGVPPIPGGTILDKRRYAAERLERIRELVVNEPRGHADMYGCLLTEPVDGGADLGVLFFHNAGWSTACGHGTIALATAAVEMGMVSAEEPETRVVLDVPSGRLPVRVRVQDGRPVGAVFRNVPSFVVAGDVRLDTSRGTASGSIAYGGAFYVFVEAAALGLAPEPASLPELIRLGREIKGLVEASREVVHPLEPELRDVYGVVYHRDEGRDEHGVVQRNVTVFADGEVDRSPCGSATSARLALLEREGVLRRGERLLHRSVIGTELEARVVGDESVAGMPAVVTEVGGSAHLTGFHQLVLSPDDPLGTGFLLR
jgi:proline racemase